MDSQTKDLGVTFKINELDFYQLKVVLSCDLTNFVINLESRQVHALYIETQTVSYLISSQFSRTGMELKGNPSGFIFQREK